MQKINWQLLLNQALTIKGSANNVYSRFHRYSFGNQMLLMMQGCLEPVATFPVWKKLGRNINKGSKAKFIWIPISRKDKKDPDKTVCGGFIMKACIFGYSDTNSPNGEDIPMPEIPTWNKQQALQSLNIKEIPFDHTDGNVQGFANAEGVAISPVAVYPLKTMFHEISHIVMKHIGDEKTDTKVKEMMAETSAYILMHELELTNQFDADASRHYIQNWLGSNVPKDDDIKAVFKAVDTILKAGLVTTITNEE